VVFEISPSHVKTFHYPPQHSTTTTTSYPQLCDVSALALLSPKTSRFVGLTTYRCRVRFRGPIYNIKRGNTLLKKVNNSLKFLQLKTFWTGFGQNLIKCDQLPMSNILYNIAAILLFDAIDRETKELPPHNIFIITNRYEMVEIRQ
jgi:hypothetical protein